MAGSDGSAGKRSEETWSQYARRVTEPLKHLRKGDGVLNIRSKEKAVVAERIDRSHTYVFVFWTQKRGKHKGRRMRTAWAAENVISIKKG
jgi:hypothetical protein